jgi:hypothetical protein
MVVASVMPHAVVGDVFGPRWWPLRGVARRAEPHLTVDGDA